MQNGEGVWVNEKVWLGVPWDATYHFRSTQQKKLHAGWNKMMTGMNLKVNQIYTLVDNT